MTSFSLHFFAFFLAFFLATSRALFASDFWDGGGSNDFWTTGQNWSDDLAPANNGTAHIFFNGSTRTTADMDLDWSVSSVELTSGSPFTLRSTGGHRLTTGNITSTPSGISGSSSRFTVDLGVIAQNGLLSISGPITVNGAIETGAGGQLLSISGSLQPGGLLLAGTISGAASFSVGNQGNRLAGNAALTGDTTIGLGGALTVEGPAGALSGTTLINLLPAATLTVGDAATTSANPNRINDAAVINNYAAALTLIGSDNAATTHEQTGTINLLQGDSSLTVQNSGAGRQTELVAANLQRQAGTTLFVRGDNLGQSGASSSRILVNGMAPTLLGGGGANGTSKISIVPWAVGDTAAGSGSTFVTYGVNGFRPLNSATEYAVSIATATAIDNVRLAAGQSVAASKSINSLLIDNNSTLTISSGQTLSLGSGALLLPAGGIITGGTLSFGSREGIVRGAGSSVQIASLIAGTGGLTTSASAGLALSGANSYSGLTYINGSLSVSTNSALGQSGIGNETVLLPNATLAITGPASSVSESFFVPQNPIAQPNGTSQASLNLMTPLTLNGDIAFTEAANSASGIAGVLVINTVAGTSLNGNITSLTSGPGTVQLRYQTPASGRATLNSVVSDGTGKVLLSFNQAAGGNGAVVVNSASTHTGGTSVGNSVKAYFNNTSGSGSGFGAVGTDVGATLGGTGILDPSAGNKVSITGGGFGGSLLAPGDPTLNGGVGTLTIGSAGSENSLFIAPGNSIQLQIGSVSDMVRIFGGLEFGPTGFFPQAIGFQISDAGGAAPGTYRLITYTTSFTGPFSAAAITSLPPGWSATLINNTAGQSIDLQLQSIPEPGSVVLIFSGLVLALARHKSRGVVRSKLCALFLDADMAARMASRKRPANRRRRRLDNHRGKFAPPAEPKSFGAAETSACILRRRSPQVIQYPQTNNAAQRVITATLPITSAVKRFSERSVQAATPM